MYPIDAFPSFWERLEQAIIDGRIISPDIVLDELKKQDDDIYNWCKDKNRDLFYPLYQDIQARQKKIINLFPRLTNLTKQRSLADPWVIALAEFKQCPVVSMEQPGSPQKPRIPDVCKALGIKYFNIIDFIREVGWRF